MASRDEIVGLLDELLTPAEFDDHCPNGLQVPGGETVDRVATGVSAHLELFRAAAERGAQLVLVHHGLFWDSLPRRMTPHMKGRLKALFDADMSLVAYHLPLDAHREVGNNVLLCRRLGFAVEEERFGRYAGRAIGAIGRLDHGLAIEELVARLEAELRQAPLVFHEGPHKIRRVGVVTGGGASSFAEAVSAGLDAFLTGEPAEPAMAEAREAGIHFIAAGHYATEKLGVQRIGEILSERLGVDHFFVEIPNPA